jgi:hypothetical protein
MELPKFKLCCGGKGCPEVTLTKSGCTIKDDNGAIISLSTAEIVEFIDKIQCFITSPPLLD